MSGDDKKIKPGDRVIYKTGYNTGVWVIVLREKIDGMGQLSLLPNTEYEVKRMDTGDVFTIYESSIIVPPKGATYINLNMLDCNCGLKYVRDGGRHSEWCAAYIKL